MMRLLLSRHDYPMAKKKEQEVLMDRLFRWRNKKEAGVTRTQGNL